MTPAAAHADIAATSREPARIPQASTKAEMDEALAALQGKKAQWSVLPIRDRIAILEELARDFLAVAPEWVEAECRSEGIDPRSALAGEEWITGPYFILRNARLLARSLRGVAKEGHPEIPGEVWARENGQVAARVFPTDTYDRLFYPKMTAEVWMDPEVKASQLTRTMAVAYRDRDPDGKVCLVLGGGNVSSIGPMDILYKVFVDNQVVVTKMHPVNQHLGPLLARGFQTLVDWGALRIVYGDAAEGEYLCQHSVVEEIHITGSDRTVEVIAFGTGEEGIRRKRENRPRLEKTISSELGNVSGVIVVPGPWTTSDLEYQAESLAAMLTNNAGFNCNATRVIVQHASWPLRGRLIDAFEDQLRRIPVRRAYYPGAAERYQQFVESGPASEIGDAGPDELPWAVLRGVDPKNREHIAFRREAFCSVCAETALEADSVAEYLDEAVRFANEALWGTLNVTLLIHPRSLEDPQVARAFDRAVADLRFGTVSINNWAAIGYGLVVTPWGAYPGHTLDDIQSGSGVVHNTLMFDRVEKAVVRSPFRMNPKPPWFPSHANADELGEQLTRFEADPSLWKLPQIFWSALRG